MRTLLKEARKGCVRWMSALVLLVSLSAAEGADYIVNADPAAPDGFRTVQAAIDAAAGEGGTERANIFIAPGTYNEAIPVARPLVTLIGMGASPEATKIAARPQRSQSGSGWGAVAEILPSARGFMARNLTFENLTPDEDKQAVAVQSSADESIYDNVRIVGYQDTLLVDNAARVYFRNCFITGDSDFIFGSATAVFDHCTIESTDGGHIAAANTRRVTANGLIFLDCRLVAGTDRSRANGDGSTATRRSTFLGRPWQWYHRENMPSTIFIRTAMGAHITGAGWDPWNRSDIPGVDPAVDRDPHSRYSEFGSTHASGRRLRDADRNGTPDTRVSWADPMTSQQAANYTLDRIFGPAEFWDARTQPEASGVQYQNVGPPWNVKAQLASLPSRPPRMRSQ